MKMFKICRNLKICLSLAIVLTVIVYTPISSASQPNFELLVDALESEDLRFFKKILESGVDSNFVGTGRSPSNWVNCMAARKNTDAWLRAIKNHGGDLNFTHQPYLGHLLHSGYANALTCSIINGSTEPFRFLVKNGADIEATICPLCKQEFGQSSLLEFTVSFRQFNKSAWLLENYPEVKRQIDDLREDRAEGFWKTVDLIRENGHTVTPKVKRQ